MEKLSNVCGANNLAHDGPLCPECRKPGKKMSVKTVRNIVAKEHLFAEEGWHLCLTPDCEVVYFGPGVFRKSDLRVKVWFKEKDPTVPVCYCKGVSAAEITRHIAVLGFCETLEDIQRHTGANTGRDCLIQNPAGG